MGKTSPDKEVQKAKDTVEQLKRERNGALAFISFRRLLFRDRP